MKLGVGQTVRYVGEGMIVSAAAILVLVGGMNTAPTGGWPPFRALSLPACVPKLVYNSILSWAGGWYFLIACEILTIGPTTQALPGLGSFLNRASAEGRTGLTVMGIATLIAIVVLMHFF